LFTSENGCIIGIIKRLLFDVIDYGVDIIVIIIALEIVE